MRKLTFILIPFILLGFIYALATPIFEASDELWHYPFVRHLADGNPLPVQDPDNVGPWKQEASQQPLYYALAAALTFWIDASDMETVRWLNLHVDNGVLTQDGNINLVIHDRGDDHTTGTALAVRLIRLVSVLMGAGTVYFTWRIARFVFPGRPELALGAAAVNAFTPMFLFISGAVNNDNLAMLLCSAAIFMMLRNFGIQDSGIQARDSLLLGVVLGLGALTKTSALGLVPLTLLSLLVYAWRHKVGATFVIRHSSFVIIPVLLIAGWWYYRNYHLYGDWLGWNAFIQVLGQRAHPASLRQLWGERWGFSLSYWGLFGGVNVPMPEWIYHVLNTAAVTAAFGLLIYLAQTLYTSRPSPLPLRFAPGTIVAPRLSPLVSRLWPLALLTGWTAAILIGLIRWATVTWSSQGRLVFPAISAIAILLIAGLFGWLPRRAGKWGVALLGGFMFLVSAVAPFAWIMPAYRPPAAPTETQIANIQYPLEVNFGGRMLLLGYDLTTHTVEPGRQLELTLYWETLAPMERDWSVFVHLNDPVIDAPIAQRDMYPGQGLLATSLLEPGRRIANRYVINTPGTAYAPAQTELVVGLYDFYTRERLETDDGRDAITLTQIDIQPQGQSLYPNPTHHNFGDQLALIGYQVEPRRLRPGETLTLTLYWQALDELEIDYTIFTHLRDLEDPSNRIYAQQDAPPGATSTWSKGQVVEAVYQLTLAEDTPPAVHEIEVGVYYQDAKGALPRLQLVTPDGRLVDDFLILGKVRVD